jgi:HK97 family phage prohead protease
MGIRVRGYFTVFGNQDLEGEVVDAGSLSNWLLANPSKSLPIYWNHAHLYSPNAKPIGNTTKIVQRKNGGYFEGELNDTAEAQEVAAVLRGGRVEASFAFKSHDSEPDKKNIVHHKDITPLEVTAANFGANPKAYIELIPGQEQTETPNGDE